MKPIARPATMIDQAYRGGCDLSDPFGPLLFTMEVFKAQSPAKRCRRMWKGGVTTVSSRKQADGKGDVFTAYYSLSPI